MFFPNLVTLNLLEGDMPSTFEVALRREGMAFAVYSNYFSENYWRSIADGLFAAMFGLENEQNVLRTYFLEVAEPITAEILTEAIDGGLDEFAERNGIPAKEMKGLTSSLVGFQYLPDGTQRAALQWINTAVAGVHIDLDLVQWKSQFEPELFPDFSAEDFLDLFVSSVERATMPPFDRFARGSALVLGSFDNALVSYPGAYALDVLYLTPRHGGVESFGGVSGREAQFRAHMQSSPAPQSTQSTQAHDNVSFILQNTA